MADNIPLIKSGIEEFARVFLYAVEEENKIIIGRKHGFRDKESNGIRPCLETLEGEAVRLLNYVQNMSKDWVAIDEIGYLECESKGYQEALLRVFEQKNVLAVVRKQNLPFLRELVGRKDALIIDMDAPFPKLGCLIMASGLGKRFGSNKLMAPFGKGPLIESVLEASEGIFDKRVVVTRHKEIAELCQSKGIAFIYHEFPYRSDTVRLGTEAMEDMDGILFCPGDQPMLQAETLMSMALSAVNRSEDICCLSYGEKRGAPVLFPSWAYGELKNLPQGMGGGYLIRKYPERVRLCQAQYEWELKDVDSPQDLQYLLQIKPLFRKWSEI